MGISAIGASHFIGLSAKLETDNFSSLEIKSSTAGLSGVLIERLHDGEGGGSFRVYEQASKSSLIADAADIPNVVSQYFQDGYDLAICKTETGHTVYSRTPKGIRISTEPAHRDKSWTGTKRFSVDDLIKSPRIRKLLIELGILSREGSIRKEQYNKLIQIKNFLGIIHESLMKLQEKRKLNIIDAACGKSYLSFVLYDLLRTEWGIDADLQCIDANSKLIERCEKIRYSLGYEGMHFNVDSITGFDYDRDVDILYSLHGCNTATDEAIAAGVRLNSKVIIVVPCCHFELRGQLHRAPFRGITKFGLLEEQFATVLTDALRGLALESRGYDVSTFRFVTDDISPKGTLIRAIKGAAPKQQSIQQYKELTKTFGISPTIGKLVLPLGS
jgi:hypothetical protein